MVEGEDYYLVSPNLLKEHVILGTLQNQRSLKETKPHGTCVASVAVGTTWGVAKNAKMIPVKFKNEATTRPAALQDAFSWVINDVISNDREGKAVINLSYGMERKFDSPSKQTMVDMPIGFAPADGSYGISSELMSELLQECWDNGIVTVVAAGNDGGMGKNLGQTLPQSLGKPNNPLITVGGINNDGSLWPDTTPEGKAGSITVSLTANVKCASSTDPNGSQQNSGTSFAAPQVAGLAAYFMSLPSLASQFQSGGIRQVAQRVKDYIVQSAYHRGSASNPLSAYNLAENALCLAGSSFQKRNLVERDSPDLQTILSAGTIVASGVTVCFLCVHLIGASLVTNLYFRLLVLVPTQRPQPIPTHWPPICQPPILPLRHHRLSILLSQTQEAPIL
jgi:subtilisin family serine protease